MSFRCTRRSRYRSRGFRRSSPSDACACGRQGGPLSRIRTLHSCGSGNRPRPSRICLHLRLRSAPFVRSAEIGCNSKQTEELQDVVRHVDLPPPKSLPAAVHELVMVVVPTLSQCDERKKEIISAVIAGVVSPV